MGGGGGQEGVGDGDRRALSRRRALAPLKRCNIQSYFILPVIGSSVAAVVAAAAPAPKTVSDPGRRSQGRDHEVGSLASASCTTRAENAGLSDFKSGRVMARQTRDRDRHQAPTLRHTSLRLAGQALSLPRGSDAAASLTR